MHEALRVGLKHGVGSIGAIVGGTLPGWMESLYGDDPNSSTV